MIRKHASSLRRFFSERTHRNEVAGAVVLTEHTEPIRTTVEHSRVLMSGTQLAEALGGHFEGDVLCRGSWCARPPQVHGKDDRFDLIAVAEALAVPMAHEVTEDGPVVALAQPAEAWALAQSLTAPDVELESLDGSPVRLSNWEGRRRVLLAFGSWCACREDLPVWQRVVDSLPDGSGVELIAIAVDDSAADVHPFVDGIAFPVLLDRDRRFCDTYGVIHVPTVVWIDEADCIVRPNAVVFADDRLRAHHGLDASVHHDALRRWVVDGVPPVERTEVRSHQMPPTPAEQQARAEFRLARWLLRQGRREQAVQHVDRAGELSPEDLTIRRAGLKLLGGDPFGPEFGPIYQDWKRSSGNRYYRARPS